MESEVKIYKGSYHGGYVASLNEYAVQQVGASEIVFDKREFKIRPSCFDDSHTYKLSKSKGSKRSSFGFTFGFDLGETTDITGTYFLEQDGDYFFLIKTNNHTNENGSIDALRENA